MVDGMLSNLVASASSQFFNFRRERREWRQYTKSTPSRDTLSNKNCPDFYSWTERIELSIVQEACNSLFVQLFHGATVALRGCRVESGVDHAAVPILVLGGDVRHQFGSRAVRVVIVLQIRTIIENARGYTSIHKACT